MTTTVDLVAAYRAAADAALDAERAFRASWRARLETLEAERGFAFLRAGLVADLVRVCAGASDASAAEAAAVDHVATAFRLERDRAAHAEIVERLAPVASAFARLAHPAPTAPDAATDAASTDVDGAGGDDAEPAPDAPTALANFEAWYAERYGAAFLARADLPMPETPLVDW